MNLSSTACHRCRGQKLRCTREQPTCQRCERLGAACSYPAPPDRKRLAERRTYTPSWPLPNPPSAHSNISNAVSPIAPGSSTATGSAVSPSCAAGTAPQNDDVQLPAVAQRLLIDVFFDYGPEASLVFHKQTFLQDWVENNVPAHNLRAVYALATIYLGPQSTATTHGIGELSWLGDLRPFGLDWAIRAGKEVLLEAEQPTLASVRTCLILVLYWFAMGDPQRNTVFSGIAYRAVRSMAWQYNASATTGTKTPSPSPPTSTRTDPVAWLQGEQFRRCFWYAWLGNCLNADHYIGGMSTDSLVLNMPLPVGDISFDHGVQAPSLKLSDYANSRDVDLFARTATDASILAQLARAIWGWSKARDLIESRSQYTASEYTSHLNTLDSALKAWELELPSALAYSTGTLLHQVVENKRYTYCLMMAAYYQSRLIIHLSMVPFFMGSASADGNNIGAIKVSTRKAIEITSSILNFAADLRAIDHDLSRLTPFFGYCMYSAAAVQIAFYFATGNSIERDTNISAALDILRVMKSHWAGLRGLWSRITMYYDEIANKNGVERDFEANAEYSPSDQLAMFDRVASSPTGAGNLSGLLGNYLLKNSLRQIHETYATDTRATESYSLKGLDFAASTGFDGLDLQPFSFS